MGLKKKTWLDICNRRRTCRQKHIVGESLQSSTMLGDNFLPVALSNGATGEENPEISPKWRLSCLWIPHQQEWQKIPLDCTLSRKSMRAITHINKVGFTNLNNKLISPADF